MTESRTTGPEAALHPLLDGIAAEVAFALALVVPFPFIVWVADELRRLYQRHRRPAIPVAPSWSGATA